jgi:hypothetical protein
MIIIWGSKVKDKSVEQGEFYCPSCRTDSNYQRRRMQEYFTLYFIPLFPTRSHGEYVHCESCSIQYSTDVLCYSREQIETATQPWTCPDCSNANPSNALECLACQNLKPQIRAA